MTYSNDYKVDVLVSIVSAQSIPNIIHASDDEIKPQKNILLATETMKTNSEYLKSVIEPTGIKVDVKDIPHDIETNYADLYDFFFSIYEENENEKIGFNATGGTKLMSMAGANVFQEFDRPVFYIDMDSNKIIRIAKDTPDESIKSKIPINVFLKSYGIKVKNSEKTVNPKQQKIRANFLNLGENIKKVNKIAYQFKDNYDNPQNIAQCDKDIIELLEQNDLLKKGKNQTHSFTSKENQEMTNGIWLEQYIFEKLSSNAKKNRHNRCCLECNNRKK